VTEAGKLHKYPRGGGENYPGKSVVFEKKNTFVYQTQSRRQKYPY